MRTLGHGHESEINVTPLIDVLLTLIVMFIVAYQIRFVHDVQVPPERNERTRSIEDSPVLDLLPDGGYALNTMRVSPGALRKVLSDVFRPRPAKLLYIRVNEGWDYGGVMRVIDVARSAGVQEIGYVPPNPPR
jgi:biopolymer transport protein ExbD